MGAIVRAFDTRSAVKEQVESLGAEFLTVDITVMYCFSFCVLSNGALKLKFKKLRKHTCSL